MGVDNQKVHNYIQDAFDDHRDGSLDYRILRAFSDVNVQRSSECDNLNLAAADHYLITRYVIVKYSPAVITPVIMAIGAYDVFYKAIQEVVTFFGGGEIVIRTGNCRATPFSPSVGLWAETGVSDGVVDCFNAKWQSSPKLKAPRSPLPFGHNILFP